MERRIDMDTVVNVIRELGVTNKYKGYNQIIDALEQKYVADYCKVTKDVYPRVARKHHTKPWNVEQNIRTVVKFCWDNSRPQLNKMAGRKLIVMPTNAEFLDILTWYVKSEEKQRS